MKLVLQNMVDGRPSVQDFGNFIKIYTGATLKKMPDVSQEFGLSEHRIRNIKSGGVKEINNNDMYALKHLIDNIRDIDLLEFLAKLSPNIVKIKYNDDSHNDGMSILSYGLYKWSEIKNQEKSDINKMMTGYYFKRFILTICDENGDFLNSLMYIKRASKDNKFLRFKTFRPIDFRRWEIVDGFFFDIEGLLFSFGKYKGGRGLRATQMNYSFEKEGVEIKGIRLSSRNNRPYAYRLFGIEIPMSIKSASIRGVCGMRSKDEMILRFPSLYRNSSVFEYLSAYERSESSIIGGILQK
ncbi:MAG: hypothetical protein ACKVOJ_08355 [Sphingomonadaceae bacterium]